VVMIASCVGIFVLYGKGKELNQQVISLTKNVSELNDSNTKLVEDNMKLMTSTYLKSFENEKALERFINASVTSKSFTSDDYASEACISLMIEARENGYWMGITMENTTDESFWSALYRKTVERASVRWFAYNVAIVGDGDIYFVDPLQEAKYYYVMTMGGDFSKYSEKDNKEVHVLR
jgi:regulator of replication initiation timing